MTETSAPSPHQALTTVLNAVGWQGRPATDVTFTGGDPVLATNFRPGTAGAVAIAAAGLGADALHQTKGNAPQDIAMDIRAGAFAMRSNRHVRVGNDPGRQWADISGLFPCGDERWVQLHCNYPWLAEGILEILGCEATKPAVAAALKTWNAQDFEDAVGARNLCGFMVRSPAEWAAHPQAAAVAALPVLTIEKIADAPREPLPAGDRPLSGIRAVELTRVIAGPVSGRTLAEHGADVMRIGRPDRPDDEVLIRDTGQGKLAADLDLREAAARDILDNLIRQADVVIQGHRPGTLAGRGVGPERVAALRPGAVFVSLSAWSHAGPWAHRRGFDSLVQCASGLAHEQGAPEAPRHLPAQAIDYVTGFLAAFGAMEGLRRRATEGGSWLVRLSLAQTGRWIDRLGRIDGPDARGLPEPTEADIADLLDQRDTVWGTMTHLKPALHLSATPPHWDRPPVPLGTHAPVWP